MRKEARKGANWKVLAICIVIVYLVAFVGSLFTSPVVKSSWFDSIKPKITPPNWVFPIVWNILFLLIGVSLYFAWMKGKNRRMTFIVYGTNLIVNMLWSLLFFGLKNPRAGFYCIGLLEISIVIMIYHSWKIDRKSSYLLIPYLLWVGFASIINWMAI